MRNAPKPAVAAALCLGLAVCGLATLAPLGAGPGAQAAEPPSRVIDLVYDDSGSMIRDESGNLINSWARAKYGMEVMAAMLGERDTLNIFLMSDFEGQSNRGGVYLTLTGDMPAEERVQRIHDGLTPRDLNTPYEAVEAAQAHLAAAGANATRWLVVMTDGQLARYGTGQEVFVPQDELVGNFKTWARAGEQIFFLGIGDGAPDLPADPEIGFYTKKVADSGQVINALTQICNQVFQRVQLAVSAENKISFDVDMKQLLVFAQGKDVKINAVFGAGATFNPVATPAVVRYSERAGVLTDPNLQGQIAEFRQLPKGDYTIDATGASQVSVYYSPDVAIGVRLQDADGGWIPLQGVLEDGEAVPAGQYTVTVGLVDAAGQWVTSDLLGSVVYEGAVTNNGETLTDQCGAQCQVVLAEGEASIDIQGTYLMYNTLPDILNLKVGVASKPLEITLELPDGVTSSNFEQAGCLDARVTIDGLPLAKDHWDKTVLTAASPNSKWTVVQGDQAPEFRICPLPDGDELNNPRSDEPITVEGTLDNPPAGPMAGQAEGVIVIEDDIPWTKRWCAWFKANWWKLLLGLLALLVAAGYWPFKCRFKQVKRHPQVVAGRSGVGSRPADPQARFKVRAWSRWTPYAAERGDLHFPPKGNYPITHLALKAKAGGYMCLTNASVFAGRRTHQFGMVGEDGYIKKGARKQDMPESTTVIWTRDDGSTYTCDPTISGN
ncbi:MAG: hypothetical protein LBD51_10135 [Bifidobacteriaceae bacterium]|jgi:hypothetical protein|nr:hypothetical protein [Bifidobacteriaceae bacterium]